MSTRSDSDNGRAAPEAPSGSLPSPQRVASLRELSQGTGLLTATEVAALRELLADERRPVWRPSAACVVLGAAIWALAFVGLWSVVLG